MNKFFTAIGKAGMVAIILLAFTACDSNDGTLEKAGKKMDKAATDMGNKLEDNCEDAKKGLDMKDTRC